MPTPEEKRQAARQRLDRQRRTVAAYFAGTARNRATSEPFTLLHVRIPEPLMERLAGFGNDAGFNASESVRTLITEALDARDEGESQ